MLRTQAAPGLSIVSDTSKPPIALPQSDLPMTSAARSMLEAANARSYAHLLSKP